jgi:hypothetical protein
MIASFAVLSLSLVSTGNTTPASALGPFRTTVVGGGGQAGGRTSMALHPVTGFPVIAYFDNPNDDLRLAVCQDAACATSTSSGIDVDGGTDGEFLSMKLNDLGHPVISYSANSNLVLAVCHDATCSAPEFKGIDFIPGVTFQSSLQLNSQGNAVVFYSTGGAMELAVCQSADCETPTITTVASVAGTSPSLGLTDEDMPVMTYDSSGGVSLAVCDDVVCTGPVTPTLVPGTDTTTSHSSMVLNAAGAPVVSYARTAGQEATLQVTTCDDLTCAGGTVVILDAVLTQVTSIAFNNLSGFPVISYYNGDNHELKVAVCQDATCGTADLPHRTVTTVENFSTTGEGNSLAIDGSGNPVIAASEGSTNNLTLHDVAATTAVVDVYAGDETTGTPLLPVDPQGTGPAAAEAKLGWPTNMAFAANGDMYFTDRFNHTVRRVAADGSQVFYVAGQPGERCADPTGTCGDGGLAVDAHLRSPWGIALDDQTPQNIYVSDYGSHKIRRIDGLTNDITTIAGTGVAGYEDGIPANVAMLNFPSGLTVDAGGDVLVADRGNHRIRKIPMDGVEPGVITTFLGTGVPGETQDGCTATGVAACELWEPSDIKMRGSSAIPSVPSTTDFFIALRATDTVLVTRAGGGDGVIAGIVAEGGIGARTPRSGIGLSRPVSLAYDALHQQLYIADSGHLQIQRLSMVSLDVVTVAGDGTGKIGTGSYVAPTDGNALDTAINFPIGVAFRPSGGQSQGTVFYTGVYENQIRMLTISENGVV